MQTKEITTNSAAETVALGVKISKWLKPGDIVCLKGNLGSGKTTFVKGVAKGLGVNPAHVNSPTFVLMNVYEEGRLPLYHFDFYRLEEQKEISNIGYDEFFYDEGVSVVEWAERLSLQQLPAECLEIVIDFEEQERRKLHISAQGSRYNRVLEKLS